MVITDEPAKINIQIDGTKIEQVRNFKYLGVTLEEKAIQELDLNERIQKANTTFYALNRNFINKKEVSQQTKLNVYKTVYRPILTYGCESWLLSTRMKSKIQAMEMKFLRRIKGISLRDKIRSQLIREELKIPSVLDFIEQRQLSWWGHLQRMANNRPVKRTYEARIQARRGRGRPSATWDSEIAKILQKRAKTWNEAKVIAKNKKQWHKLVHEQHPYT